jgi:hypothetical protein
MNLNGHVNTYIEATHNYIHYLHFPALKWMWVLVLMTLSHAHSAVFLLLLLLLLLSSCPPSINPSINHSID